MPVRHTEVSERREPSKWTEQDDACRTPCEGFVNGDVQFGANLCQNKLSLRE